MCLATGSTLRSRLQALAEPDTICISDTVYRDVVKKVDLGTVVLLGKPKLKNIAERFRFMRCWLKLPQAFGNSFKANASSSDGAYVPCIG